MSAFFFMPQAIHDRHSLDQKFPEPEAAKPICIKFPELSGEKRVAEIPLALEQASRVQAPIFSIHSLIMGDSPKVKAVNDDRKDRSGVDEVIKKHSYNLSGGD